MPGRTPAEAVEAFLAPLRGALACVGTGHFTLSPKARSVVGESHSWVINGGGPPVAMGGGYGLMARMVFEIQDRGASLRDQRFKVGTRAYLYSVVDAERRELLAAHWHPGGNSPVEFPHWHIAEAAIATDGVFLARAHIPSPRVSFEWMVRMAVESLPGVEPRCDDWRDRLTRTEDMFWRHASWGRVD